MDTQQIIFTTDIFLTSLIQYTISSISGVSTFVIHHLINDQIKVNYACAEIIYSLRKSIGILIVLCIYFYLKYGFMEAIISTMLNIVIIHFIYDSFRNEIIYIIIKNKLKISYEFDNNLLLQIFT